MCFICVCMYIRSYPAAIVYLSKYMQCTMLGGDRVTVHLLTTYLFPSFYCDLFKFFNNLVCLLFIAYCSMLDS